MPLVLHEDWYNSFQTEDLRDKIEIAKKSPKGMFIEIGCWEGNSTVSIANSINPFVLNCVDSWSSDDNDHDPYIKETLSKRNVYQIFLDNMEQNTDGNFKVYKTDCIQYLETIYAEGKTISFIHLDGPHDYASVKRSLELIVPMMEIGGVICGDDFMNAHSGREDLQGGVERAVRESFHGFVHDKTNVKSHNFWYWVKE